LGGLPSDVIAAVLEHPEVQELSLALAAVRDAFTDEETWCVQYLRDMRCFIHCGITMSLGRIVKG